MEFNMTVRSREKKMKVTEQNWIEKLKELQATFIDDRQAHRQTVYLTTTEAFRVSVKLRALQPLGRSLNWLVRSGHPQRTKLARTPRLPTLSLRLSPARNRKRHESQLGNVP